MAEGRRTAVVVDDDPVVRLVLKAALSAAGFAVHEAGTGPEGIDLVRTRAPDLITLDLELPGMSGSETLRQMRTISDAYIIMISATADETDRLLGLAVGADDFVTKPFSPRELQARVSAMFRRPRGLSDRSARVPEPRPATDVAAPHVPAAHVPAAHVPAAHLPAAHVPAARAAEAATAAAASVPANDVAAEHIPVEPDGVLRHGPLAVDVEGRSAWLVDTELPLTRTEFDLLATLASNARKVWRRQALLDEVWGDQWTEHHVVEVHMGNLRRKLGEAAAGGARVIVTVRGVGYRLAPVNTLPSSLDPSSVSVVPTV